MMEDQNGSYIYVSPAMSLQFLNVPGMREWATSHGVDFGPNDSSIAINRPSGGVLHDSGTWNAQTGQYDQGLDWGNIVTMVVGGLMTAGAADALLSSGAVSGVPAGVTSVSDAPELAGTVADTSGGLGSVGAAGAADAGTFAAPAAAAPAAGGAGEFAAVGGVEGLPEGLAGTAPIIPGTLTAGAPAAGGFAPAAAAPIASTPVTLPPTGLASTAGADYSASAFAPASAGPSYKQIADLLKAGGAGVGQATSAAGNNQLARGNAQVAAARGIEDAYLSDAELEQQQRSNELKDTYREGVVSSGTRSPYDPVAPVYGQDYKTSVSNLSRQGAADLAQAPIYGIRNIPKPGDIYPDPKTAFAETGMQKVGDWLGPALTIAGNVPPSVYSKIFSWL
jgi:hypothetical protein